LSCIHILKEEAYCYAASRSRVSADLRARRRDTFGGQRRIDVRSAHDCSIISIVSTGGQIFEPGPHINAALANRSARFAARWFDLAFIINAFDFAA
jgi:hypothetical protein